MAASSSSTALAGDSYHYLFKMLLVGDSNVGKTSILLRFTQGEFKEQTRNTVGVDLKVKLVSYRGKTVKLTIWDTAGQERFRTLTSAYYRGAHGIILVYDVTNRASFENVQHWLKEIDMYSTNDDAVKMLIGNKIDVGDESSGRQVTKQEGLAFARANSMLFIEASAKTKVGIQQAFDELIQKILDVPSLLESEGASSNESQKDSVDINQPEDGGQGGGCCG